MSDTDYEARLKTTGRNDDCPCGSGKKYKKCHLVADQAAETAALQALEEEAMAKAEAAGDTETAPKDAGDPARFGKGRRKQPASKGRRSDGAPGDIPRRGAV